VDVCGVAARLRWRALFEGGVRLAQVLAASVERGREGIDSASARTVAWHRCNDWSPGDADRCGAELELVSREEIVGVLEPYAGRVLERRERMVKELLTSRQR
jgi:hypothetical protein